MSPDSGARRAPRPEKGPGGGPGRRPRGGRGSSPDPTGPRGSRLGFGRVGPMVLGSAAGSRQDSPSGQTLPAVIRAGRLRSSPRRGGMALSLAPPTLPGCGARLIFFDPAARLWDVVEGRERRSFRDSASLFSAIALAPDGRTLEAGRQDGAITFWDTATGRRLRALQGHENSVRAPAFAPE